MANGSAVPGQSNAEKTRNYVSEAFERLVRVFVAGSDQLARDTGIPWSGPTKIMGFYRGLSPDLFNSADPEHIVPGGFRPEIANCGIANAANTFFKFPDGNIKPETPGNNHQCSNGRGDRFSSARGEIVNTLMNLMKKMQADLITHGRIVHASTFGAVDYCGGRRAEILSNRELIKKHVDNLKTAMDQKSEIKDTLYCGEEESATSTNNAELVIGSDGQKKLSGWQFKTCFVSAMQNRVELNMVSQYMYCTWKATADEIIHRSLGAILNATQAKAPVEPEPLSWGQKLAVFFQSFWITNACAITLGDGVSEISCNSMSGGTLYRTSRGWVVFPVEVNLNPSSRPTRPTQPPAPVAPNCVCSGSSGCNNQGSSCSSSFSCCSQAIRTSFSSSATHYNTVTMVTYSSSVTTYNTNMANYSRLDPTEMQTLAELAVNTHDPALPSPAPSASAEALSEAITYLKGMGNCARLCYPTKRSIDLLPHPSEAATSAYDHALQACQTKKFMSWYWNINQDYAQQCKCCAEGDQECLNPSSATSAGVDSSPDEESVKEDDEIAETLGSPPLNTIDLGDNPAVATPGSNVVMANSTELAAATAGTKEKEGVGLPGGGAYSRSDASKKGGLKSQGNSTLMGSNMTLGKVSTDPAFGSKDKSHYFSDPNGGTYSSAGGGKAQAGSGSGTGSSAGSAGVGGSKTQEFGSDEGEDVELSGSDRPDYFDLLKTGDSIFKVVSRRYVTKSKQWFNKESKANKK